MKTQIKTLVVIALSSLLTLACSKKSSNNSAAAPGAGANGGSNVILEMRYFRGGYFAPPNTPNWSYDLTIDFTQFNQGYLVTAAHPDSLCYKEDGYLTSHHTEIFLDLVSQLLLYVSNGPIAADAGVEYIEFTMQDGSKRRYHLMNMEVPAGEYYASNPDDVRDFLRDLDDSLNEVCQ